MKRSESSLYPIFIGCFIVVTCLLVTLCYYHAKWQHRHLYLNKTIETGILLQMVVDQFYATSGHYPSPNDIKEILCYISPFREQITKYKTDEIRTQLDNRGGWYYNQALGKIKIDSDQVYAIGFQSFVNPSEMDFHAPTKIIVEKGARSMVMSYSYLNSRLDAWKPDIQQIINFWLVTNTDQSKPFNPSIHSIEDADKIRVK